jgi:hypothetical protein
VEPLLHGSCAVAVPGRRCVASSVDAFDDVAFDWKTSAMDSMKLVNAACPTINEVGWTFYFVPTTVARGEKLGLDMFGFYFLGRGGVLGDVDASVVSSAFGYFNPDTIATVWEGGRLKVSPKEAGREFFAAAHEFGRARLDGVAELDTFVGAATKVVDRARRDVAGLTLFAATAEAPVPADAPAAAMHLLVQLREFRGSAHLLAVVAEGLEPRVAHYLRRPEMFTMFGWQPTDAPTDTAGAAELLALADERTDRLVAPAYSVLNDDEAVGMLSALDAIAPRLREGPA